MISNPPKKVEESKTNSYSVFPQSLQKFLVTEQSDYYLMNAEIFGQSDQELLAKMKSLKIPIETLQHKYIINTRYLFSQNNKKTPFMMLHGHDSSCTWASWLRIGLIFFELGHNVILLDLPAYGQSSVDDQDRINPKYYLEDGPNFIVQILDKMEIKKIHAVGWCGGGATFYRTITQFPERFADRHIFHNVVISEIPQNFQETLDKHKMQIWVSWCFDPDHSKFCVGYQWLAQKRQSKHPNIILEVIQDDELPLIGLWSQNMGRKTSDVCMFETSLGYQEFLVGFINQQKIFYKANPVSYEWIPDETQAEIIQKSQIEFNSNNLDEELQMALALSLSEQEANQQFQEYLM